MVVVQVVGVIVVCDRGVFVVWVVFVIVIGMCLV